jgi:signal peptidase II
MAVTKYLYGALTGFGVVVALLTAVADQASKLWLLFVFDLGARQPVHVGQLIDLVLVRNRGISYGLFAQSGPLGQMAVLAVMAAAVVLLWIWLAWADSRLTALALGLIIGGAIGNAIDRATYGAVADFVVFHIDTIADCSFRWYGRYLAYVGIAIETTQGCSFRWYVFNLADVAIVAGVVGLLYESTLAKTPQKRPDR